MQGHAGSRGRGGLAPLNQSIHPTKTAAVDPLSLHFVPQGHGGGYIYTSNKSPYIFCPRGVRGAEPPSMFLWVFPYGCIMGVLMKPSRRESGTGGGSDLYT